MQDRKEHLLQLIVESYLKTAEPVGSNFLIESTGLNLSGATIRNEMRELEEQGYLTHPHTSAGRIPTELGYTHYINNIMEVDAPKDKVKKEIEDLLKSGDEKAFKNIAKYIAEYVDNSVIVALNPDSIYYTGISNLFSQPEFKNYAHAVSVSSIFDECEDKMDIFYNAVNSDVKILLGKDNPLGNACGTVATRFGESGLFVVLGPMRMDYAKTAGILKYIKEII